MPFTEFYITGLRGFATQQTLRLAQPTGAPGSGLTVIVGPNSGGKSTIVDGFRLLGGAHSDGISEGRRNSKAGGKISLTLYNSQQQSFSVATVPAGGSQTRSEGPPLDVIPFVLPSRRYFNPYFGQGQTDRNGFARYRMTELRGQPLNHFSGRLMGALERADEFNALLARVVEPVPKWTIEKSEQGSFYLKIVGKSGAHTSEGIGEGIVSLLFMIDALYDSAEGDLIVIDEPELSLHPALQRKLMALFEEYAKSRQLVLATHSPYFIGTTPLANGGRLARAARADEDCFIANLSPETGQAWASLVSNKNNPHLVGLDAREVFFMDDRVVLVEGQEDVIIYKHVAKELSSDMSGEFLGWGVGGYGNMQLFCTMLDELQYQRVTALFDANATATAETIRTKFPRYQVVSIPTNDVRTKSAVKERPEVRGLVDEKWHVRPEHDKQTRAVFEKIRHYMQTGKFIVEPVA